MGRFAGAELGRHPWLAVDQLRDRMARSSGAAAGRRWPGPRSPTSPTGSGRGARRCCASSTRCPRCRSTATPRPQNLPGRDGDDVVAIDWGTLGHGPVGADLGLFLQNAREEPEPLLDAYLLGLPDGVATGRRSPSGCG